MQPGTEPQCFIQEVDSKASLRDQKLAQSQQPNEEDTPIIESVSEISHLWEGNKIDIESNQPENNVPIISNIEPEWEIEDPKLPEKETSGVISTDSAHWSVEPSMASSLPVLKILKPRLLKLHLVSKTPPFNQLILLKINLKILIEKTSVQLLHGSGQSF